MKRYPVGLGVLSALLILLTGASAVEIRGTQWQRFEWRASTFVPSAQEQPALTVDARGRIVTVWSSRRQHDGRAGVFAQRFDADGVALGTETALSLWDRGHQTDPAIAADGAGGVWIAWQSFGQNGYAGAIIARHFDAYFNGGPEIAVGQPALVHETQPALAAWADGRAVLTWTVRTAPQEPVKVRARILGPDGQPASAELAVGPDNCQTEAVPAVAVQPNGAFAIAYSVFTDGLPDGIRVQSFDHDGSPAGQPVVVSGPRGRSQVEPVLAATPTGYIVAWHDCQVGGDDYDVVARRLDSDGRPVGDAFVVSNPVADSSAGKTPAVRGAHNGAAIAVNADGGFAIAWNGTSEDRPGILARFFDAAAAPLGNEFRINARTKGPRAMPAASASTRLAFGQRGELLCAWSGEAGAEDKNSANVTMLAPARLELASRLAGRVQGVTAGMPVAAGTAIGDDIATPHIPPTFDPNMIDTGERDFRNDDSGFGFTAIQSTGWTPPDPHMAVGPTHIVVMTNGAIAFFQKNGTRDFLQDISGTAGFWGSVGATSFIFDPEVLFDPLSGRFFAMAGEAYAPPNQTKSYVLIAVSDDSNPNGTWYKYRFDTTALAGDLYDSPNIAVDPNVVYITGDGFGISANYPVYTFDKASLLAGLPPAVQRSLVMPTATQSAGIPPVSFDNPPGLYMCEHSENSPATNVRLIVLRDPLGAPYFTTYTLPVTSYTAPEDAPSLGTTVRVSTFDARFWSVAYRNGSLWATQHVGSSRVRARWYEFHMNGWPTSGQNPSVAQWGEIDPGGTVRTFFTSITVNPTGDAAITCARSSPSEYFSMLTTFRLASDTPNTFRLLATEIASNSVYTQSRWGDYSAIESDPARPDWFWAHHEYASSSLWRTWVGRIQLPARPGDLNCDGVVNFDDINPFVLALSDPAGYALQYPNCNILAGDINGDSLVNFNDINPFVALLAP